MVFGGIPQDLAVVAEVCLAVLVRIAAPGPMTSVFQTASKCPLFGAGPSLKLSCPFRVFHIKSWRAS